MDPLGHLKEEKQMHYPLSFMGQPSLTMSTVKQWAADICSKHLSGGMDPTSELVKCAHDNSLTVPQIEILAGEINKTIHTAKYAQAEDKYHAADFPLASAKAALEQLQAASGSTKTASASMGVGEYLPDPVFAKPEFDFNKAFGVTEEVMAKTAGEIAVENKKEFEKVALLRSKQFDAAEMSKHAAEEAEVAFIKQARSIVLDGLNSDDRLKKFGFVLHAVKCAGGFEEAKKPLAKLAFVVGAEGFVHPEQSQEIVDYLMSKKADEQAPQALVSEWLNAKVVNGSHPLVVTLKTYLNSKERAAAEATRFGVCDDKHRIMGQKIRGL